MGVSSCRIDDSIVTIVSCAMAPVSGGQGDWRGMCEPFVTSATCPPVGDAVRLETGTSNG